MSSHHVVKEKQEPALIIDDLSHFDWELLGQLLEWNPTIIARGHLAAQLEAAQIKVDIIFPSKHLSATEIRHLHEDHFIEQAINHLILYGYPAVNIIAHQAIPEIVIPFLSRINIVLFKSHQKIYAVRSGFRKWKPGNQYIEIFSKGTNLTYTGLIKLNDQCYKTVADGFFCLYFSEDFIFIAEDI